jgi:hypothetical protein
MYLPQVRVIIFLKQSFVDLVKGVVEVTRDSLLELKVLLGSDC